MWECNIQKGHIWIACDGLSALKQAQSRQPINPDTPHYDLIGAIRNIRQATPIWFSFEHVRGHQDSGITMVLTCTVWMNIKMDTLAKATISQNTGPLQYYLEGEPWTCYIEGHCLVKHATAALWRHINTIMIEAHWAKKQRYKSHNGRSQNGRTSHLRFTKGTTMMGGQVGGTLSTTWDKYEKMETLARGLLPKVPSTHGNKSPPYSMPSHGGNPNLDNGNWPPRPMVTKRSDGTRNQKGNHQWSENLAKRWTNANDSNHLRSCQGTNQIRMGPCTGGVIVKEMA